MGLGLDKVGSSELLNLRPGSRSEQKHRLLSRPRLTGVTDRTFFCSRNWPFLSAIGLYWWTQFRSVELGVTLWFGVILEVPSLGSGCHPQGSHRLLHPSSPSSLGRSLICLQATCLYWERGEKEKVKIPGETHTGQLHQHVFLECLLCPKHGSRPEAAALSRQTQPLVSLKGSWRG